MTPLIFIVNTYLTKQIPSLNTNSIESLQPGNLVRFRCMVQDMPGDTDVGVYSYEVLDPETNTKVDMRVIKKIGKKKQNKQKIEI